MGVYWTSISGWKLRDRLKIQEDEHDELFITVVTGLQRTHNDSDLGTAAMNEAVRILGPAVETCGLFVLPVIWVCALRMLRQGATRSAIRFLAEAGKRSRELRGNQPFTEVMARLLYLYNTDAQSLERALVMMAYEEYTDVLLEKIQGDNLSMFVYRVLKEESLITYLSTCITALGTGR